ncbi:MAG: PAS domain-containing protein [Candidatus Obscuribacterales bacterium]|nr:PAS domain-containing protein [Candidatus Obscuribacterales bacterium]
MSGSHDGGRDGRDEPLNGLLHNLRKTWDHVDSLVYNCDLERYGREKDEQLLLLQRAVESARNGICITNPRLPDNPIIYVNDAFLVMTGYRREQVLGRNCRFLQRDERDQQAIELIRRAIKEETSITTVLRNYRRDGSLFWNELTVSPVHDESGRLMNFVGVQNDISARKEAERRVSEFYSVISHELRTPLSSINGALAVIADGSTGKINPQAMRMVKIALESSERLMRLISDILDWKKIEAGKFKLALTNAFPSAIVDAVVDSVSSYAEASGVHLKKEVLCDRPLTLDVDRTTQILTNLVDNAIKFSPRDETVLVRVELLADTTRFSVIDRGPGIAPQDLDKLFKVFQQLDSSDSRLKGGTGLGLSISKSLVELHGGQIGVDSVVGQGSTFWFEFYCGPGGGNHKEAR